MGEGEPITTQAIRVSILGPVQIDGDRSGEPFGPRLRRLLARMAVADGMVVDEATLIAAVWPDGAVPPQDPSRSLQVYISRLRARLGQAAIERAGSGYRLVPQEVLVDAREMERSLAAARASRDRGDVQGAVSALDDALGVWRGPALVEFADEWWAHPEAARLEELRLGAQEERAGLLLDLDGATPELTAELRSLTLAHPHREEPTRLLMIAHHRAGRQAAALDAFARFRRRLATDLGLEPSAELRTLEDEILMGRLVPDPTDRYPSVRGYEVLERLGEGSFSIVYRGRQPSVNREVAIKRIRAELANRPEFVRRFEAEAQLVARIEHPHIVPLYDYWREPGSAFLVMRLLRGGTLEGALQAGPWPVDRTLRMAGQIGAALAAAHRAGVVHRDVKPANVLLDEEGNAYLSDFGIALASDVPVDAVAGRSTGTPAYAPPEQLRREPVGPSADVHALAVTVHDALTRGGSGTPHRLAAVLSRATAPDPADRFSTVDSLVAALRLAAEGDGGGEAGHGSGDGPMAPAGVIRNPYKGLRAFEEADADDFHGRELLVGQLVDAVSAHRLVAVVGPSGSGKSSAVRAGLLPRLRLGAVAGSADWYMATFTPSMDPFDELAQALAGVAVDAPPPDLALRLAEGEAGLRWAVDRLLPDGGEVLLVVDQMEELYVRCDDERLRRAFLQTMASAVAEVSRVRVVLVLRADFYDRPLTHAAMGSLVREATVPVLPLAADELERAIVTPALASGCELEPGLLAEIVADVAYQPAALPMLQYALTELHDRQVSGLLQRATYHELGRVPGAIARRAEELYRSSTPEEQAAIRSVLAALVEPADEGRADSRRRARQSQLGAGPLGDAVVSRLGAARLLSFDHDPVTREPTVEVAHDALLRQWPRLRGWLDDDRDALRVRRRLSRAANEWDAAGRPAAELYSSGRLDAVEQAIGAGVAQLAAVDRDFLTASDQARQARLAADRRAGRRLRRLLATVAVVAVLALVASVVAVVQRRAAENSAALAARSAARAEAAAESERLARHDAVVRRMVSDAGLLAYEDPALAMLLAVAAHQEDPGADTLGALQRVLGRTDGLLGYLGSGTAYGDIDGTDDGLLAARTDGRVDVWSTLDRARRHAVAIAGTGRLVVADGRAVTSTSDGTLHAVDLASGRIEASAAPAGAGPVTELAASADGTLVAVGRQGGTVELRATAGLAPVNGLRLPSGSSDIDGLVFSADGTSLVAAELAGGRVWRTDLGTGAVVWAAGVADVGRQLGIDPESLPADQVTGQLRRDPAGTGVMVPWYNGGTVRLDLSSGELTGFWPIAAAWAVDALAVDERRVITGAGELDLDTGLTVDRYRTAQGPAATGVAVLGNQRLAAIASGNGIALWSTDGAQLLARSLPGNGANRASLDPAGARLAATRWPGGSTELWDLATGQLVESALGAVADGHSLAWVPAAGQAVSSQLAGTATTPRRPDTLAPLGPALPLTEWGDYATDPDGRYAYVAGLGDDNGHILVYEVATGAQVDRISGLNDRLEAEGVPRLQKWVAQVEPSPDGSVLVVKTFGGRLGILRAPDWGLDTEIELPGRRPVANVAFSHGGRVLAVQDAEGTIHLLDGATFRPLVDRLAGEPGTTGYGAARLLAFGPDDATLVVGSGDGVQLWDVGAATAIGNQFPNVELTVATPSAGGRRAVTAVGGRLLVWDLDVGRWADVACRAAGRNLTRAEWDQFGPGDEYRATCPQWPPG